ncbi:H-2 class I histocompatibility antigen, L-D alpha chain [Anabarilius grahami]|uniref:H-2 class I histocompatibility antigen, L-D alpha chain n=1 Tax=Anabarilius grahami TaxID=495550 RepID=A0A3N0XPU1_ANAGA|nr:H-2 class I histocompatibility antigen, L-D alpha chain [Anabarilius grahami]
MPVTIDRNLMEDTLSQSGCVSTGAEQATRAILDSFLWKLSVKLNLMEVTENTHSTPTDTHQKHFLHYKFTVLTKADTFPEFSAEVAADGRRIKHFSDDERVWILTEDDWTEPPKDPPGSRNWFIHQIRTLTNCTNSQCSELHVLQRIIGCELEKLPDGTVNLTVFDEYGFDGEDFISFNSDTMKWIDKNPKAKETKEEWDHQTGRNQFLKYFLKNYMNWISTFNNTKQSSPDVRVSVRKAPDDDSKLVLTCLATGFYPRDVQMNIRLNRNILEDQTSSGIRPNDDETFQMRISVKINRNLKGSYDCRLTHSSLTEPVSVKWDGRCSDCETDHTMIVIAGVAAAVVLAVIVIITGYCIYKQKSSQCFGVLDVTAVGWSAAWLVDEDSQQPLDGKSAPVKDQFSTSFFQHDPSNFSAVVKVVVLQRLACLDSIVLKEKVRSVLRCDPPLRRCYGA